MSEPKPMPSYWSLYQEVTHLNGWTDKLRAENDKLRELVRDMWHDGMCECDERGACAECEYHYTDRMRELGVDADVIQKRRYINGPSGAACTLQLKKRVRQKWENEHFQRFTYVWGFDLNEKARAERTIVSMPEYDHEFPLIDAGLTKADCHALCEEWGIKRPAMYDLGYPNNNCVGCVKGGIGYWNKIREDFPEVFERRARQEREIGHSCIKGVFLDELEVGRGKNNPIVPECSLACVWVQNAEGRL